MKAKEARAATLRQMAEKGAFDVPDGRGRDDEDVIVYQDGDVNNGDEEEEDLPDLPLDEE